MRTGFLCRQAERILIDSNQVRKVAVPEIVVKAVSGCNVQKPVDLSVNSGDQFLRYKIARLIVPADISHLKQYIILRKVSVN